MDMKTCRAAACTSGSVPLDAGRVLRFIFSGELEFVFWWISVAESFKFYVLVYFGSPDICDVGSQTVSASVCFGGFIRLLRLDFLLMNWQTITGTCGGL
jgi:hypothetical protein